MWFIIVNQQLTSFAQRDVRVMTRRPPLRKYNIYFIYMYETVVQSSCYNRKTVLLCFVVITHSDTSEQYVKPNIPNWDFLLTPSLVHCDNNCQTIVFIQ